LRQKVLDAGEILDDLIPMCRQDGGVFIGNAGYLKNLRVPLSCYQVLF
jgi:hypothetical protein